MPEISVMKGVIYLEDCESATQFQTRFLTVQGPLTSVTVGADNAEHLMTSIDGSSWLKLAGAHAGLKWAAMETP